MKPMHISFKYPLLMYDGAVFPITAIISINSPILPLLDHQYLSSDHDRLFQWTVSLLFHLLMYFKCSLYTQQKWWPNGYVCPLADQLIGSSIPTGDSNFFFLTWIPKKFDLLRDFKMKTYIAHAVYWFLN